MEKYLYFRTEATDANDDATGDSACFPASSLMGMQPTADDALTLYFKSMLRRDPTGSVDHANSLDNICKYASSRYASNSRCYIGT